MNKSKQRDSALAIPLFVDILSFSRTVREAGPYKFMFALVGTGVAKRRERNE